MVSIMVTEQVWERIKAAAQRNAAKGLRPSLEDSKRVVKGIVLRDNGPMPEEAIDFYARELTRLSSESK